MIVSAALLLVGSRGINQVKTQTKNSIRLELINFHFRFKSPDLIVVTLPKSCKVVPLFGTKAASTRGGKEFIKISTGGTGEIVWFVGYQSAAEGNAMLAKMQSVVHAKPVTIGTWSGGQLWNQDVQSGQARQKRENLVNMLWKGPLNLTVSPSWAQDDEKSKATAIACAEDFVRSFEISPKAKTVPPFVAPKKPR